MGVLFSLGRDDHKVVGDFIANGAGSIAGLQVTAPNRARQREVIDAARDANIEVLIDLQTEKSVVPNAPRTSVASLDAGPFDVEKLSKLSARSALVEAAADAQIKLGATNVVLPHFYVSDKRDLDLWIDLNMLTLSHMRDAGRIRPVIAGQIRFLTSVEGRQQLVRGLIQFDAQSVELRLSPLGGGHDGSPKVSHVFGLIEELQSSSVQARLGWAGAIGHSVFATGLATDFVTGVGYRERFNFRDVLASKTKTLSATPKKQYGAQSGVYLPSAGVTVSRKIAEALYAESALKAKLSCSIDRCAEGHDGPVRYPREHFIHSMAEFAGNVKSLPASWRSQNELNRLRRAVDLVEFINDCAIDDVARLPTRTLRSLLTAVTRRTSRAA